MAECARCGGEADAGDAFCPECRSQIGQETRPGGGTEVLQEAPGGAERREDHAPVRVEDALQPAGRAADYAALRLGGAPVSVERLEIAFEPFYATEFDVFEEYRAPDGSAHEHRDGGLCYMGARGEPLFFRNREVEDNAYDDDEEEASVEDLLKKEPGTVIVEEPGARITRVRGTGMERIEKSVRDFVADINTEYVRVGQKSAASDGGEDEYRHAPEPGSIKCRIRTAYVPKLHVTFRCGRRRYERIVVMSSGRTVLDETSACSLCGRRAAAACAECGAIKCRGHIAPVRDGQYKCKYGRHDILED